VIRYIVLLYKALETVIVETKLRDILYREDR
jgi:hypothetical protein